MTFDLGKLVRDNIRELTPYSSARSEFVDTADVFLDANENAFGSPAGSAYNRYPDPMQSELKARISKMEDVRPFEIFVGNGSDEAIDLLFRIFCRPGIDEVIICPPTYGMYRVSADINGVAILEVKLTADFALDTIAIQNALTERTKLIFICSPNNPTGNLMDPKAIVEIAGVFNGIVVVDEAYIHFANVRSMTRQIRSAPNLVVLQTFSKAWGMAGIRVGLAFANESIIALMNRVKPPYNVSGIGQEFVLKALDQRGMVNEWIETTLAERERLTIDLQAFPFIDKIYPSDANFILARTIDADAIYNHLVKDQIVVRNRTNVELCEGCLRITVGTPAENDRLLTSLKRFEL